MDQISKNLVLLQSTFYVIISQGLRAWTHELEGGNGVRVPWRKLYTGPTQISSLISANAAWKFRLSLTHPECIKYRQPITFCIGIGLGKGGIVMEIAFALSSPWHSTLDTSHDFKYSTRSPRFATLVYMYFRVYFSLTDLIILNYYYYDKTFYWSNSRVRTTYQRPLLNTHLRTLPFHPIL